MSKKLSELSTGDKIIDKLVLFLVFCGVAMMLLGVAVIILVLECM